MHSTTGINNSLEGRSNGGDSSSTHDILLILFLTSLSSTTEVILECSIGFILAKFKPLKILNRDRIRFLSKLLFNLFIPSLFFVNLTTSFSLEVFQRMYMVCLYSIVLEVLGIVFGKLLFLKWFWRDRLDQTSRIVLTLTLICHTSLSLPLVYVVALCNVSTLGSNPIYNMTFDQAHKSAMTALSVFIIPTEIAFFTIGVGAFRYGAAESLKKEDDGGDHSKTLNASIDTTDPNTTTTSISTTTIDMVSEVEVFKNNIQKEAAIRICHDDSHSGLIIQHHDDEMELIENDPIIDKHDRDEINERHVNLVTQESAPDDHDSSTINTPQPVFIERLKKYFSNTVVHVKELLKNLVTPPLIAILIAIVIASIGPVKEFLITEPPIFISSVKQIFTVFSQAVSPIALIILGGNLAITLIKEDETTQNSNNELNSSREIQSWPRRILNALKHALIGILRIFKIKKMHPLAVAISLFTKLIVFPLIGVGLVYGGIYFKVLPANDPLMILVVLIQFSMPMAMSLTSLSSLNNDYGMEQVCELLLWHYSLCPLTLSFFSTWFLSLSCQLLGEESIAKCHI